MSECSSVLYEKKHGIAKLTLNKPEKHNAFDDHLITALHKQLIQIEKDTDIRLVLLTGKGDNFSAGADLEWMRQMANYSKSKNKADALRLAHLLEELSQLSKPVIGLVQGRIFGGGNGLIACCDIVVAAENAKFCFSEVKLGLIPATIAPYVLRTIGFSATRRYFLTAETFGVAEALRLGFIHEVVPLDQLEKAGEGFAKLILNNGPNALKAAKKLINKLKLYPVDKATTVQTAKFLSRVRASLEAKEGIDAFFQKKKPSWVKED